MAHPPGDLSEGLKPLARGHISQVTGYKQQDTGNLADDCFHSSL